MITAVIIVMQCLHHVLWTVIVHHMGIIIVALFSKENWILEFQGQHVSGMMCRQYIIMDISTTLNVWTTQWTFQILIVVELLLIVRIILSNIKLDLWSKILQFVVLKSILQIQKLSNINHCPYVYLLLLQNIEMGKLI